MPQVVDIITDQEISVGVRISGRAIGHPRFRVGQVVLTSSVKIIWHNGPVFFTSESGTIYRVNDPGVKLLLRELDELQAQLTNIISG